MRVPKAEALARLQEASAVGLLERLSARGATRSAGRGAGVVARAARTRGRRGARRRRRSGAPRIRSPASGVARAALHAPERLGTRCRLAAARRGGRAHPRPRLVAVQSLGEANERARSFYERRGWRLNGETRVVPFLQPLDVGHARLLEWPGEEGSLRSEPDGLAPRPERAQRRRQPQRGRLDAPANRRHRRRAQHRGRKTRSFATSNGSSRVGRGAGSSERTGGALPPGRDDARRAVRRRDLVREDGRPTYHLASVVDDVDFGITHVIRGNDHRPNEALHRRLTEALGRHRPSTSITG